MKIRLWCLLLLAEALTSPGARAEEKTADPQPAASQQPPASAASLPSWAPGPLATDREQVDPARVSSRSLGVAFTLPEPWRADDVSWRELDVAEAQAINPIAEGGLIVEMVGKGDEKQRLLTMYRVPLATWREADRDRTAGPGRVTISSSEKGFVVVRPADVAGSSRYATLLQSVEDAVGSLALFDNHKDARHLPPDFGSNFAGKLIDGSPVALVLEAGGKLTLTYGKDQKQLTGKWLQRETQLIGHLDVDPEKNQPTVLFHYDGVGLIAMKWDPKLFGNIGVRMDKSE